MNRFIILAILILILLPGAANTPGMEAPSAEFSVKGMMGRPAEKSSPYDRVSPSQIHVHKDSVVIDIDSPYLVGFTDTNSMDPVIDIEANAIQIIPSSPEEIHVGDIISFKGRFFSDRTIHRVVETGVDEAGWFAITKGDNSNSIDPDPVRFKDLRVVVAVIY